MVQHTERIPSQTFSGFQKVGTTGGPPEILIHTMITDNLEAKKAIYEFQENAILILRNNSCLSVPLI